MKKVNYNVRTTIADTVSDALVRLYKEAAAKTDGAIAKDANLAAILAEVEKLSADITTAIKADKISTSLEDADTKRDELIRSLFTLLLSSATTANESELITMGSTALRSKISPRCAGSVLT